MFRRTSLKDKRTRVVGKSSSSAAFPSFPEASPAARGTGGLAGSTSSGLAGSTPAIKGVYGPAASSATPMAVRAFRKQPTDRKDAAKPSRHDRINNILSHIDAGTWEPAPAKDPE